MIGAEAFCYRLAEAGYRAVSGVPCSFLAGPLAVLERTAGYVAAPNEGVALAVAAGSELTGRKSAVIVQNSGVGNLLDPLTSLFMSYRIPLLLFVSLRGWPDARDDEEHHTVMGAATQKVFETVGARTHLLEPSDEGLDDALALAEAERQSSAPLVVLVPRHTVGPATASDAAVDGARDPLWRREEVIRTLGPYLGDALVITTTGMISRELFGYADRPEHFYMQGSMGQAIGLGIGAARSWPDRRVVVLDGDGAALMQLGGMALAGETGLPNLVHVVLDNAVYDSTGGQRTRARAVSWRDLGRSLGYRTSAQCRDPRSLRMALNATTGTPGPHLVAITIDPGGAGVPPRISGAWRNPQITNRFRDVAVASRPLATETQPSSAPDHKS